MRIPGIARLFLLQGFCSLAVCGFLNPMTAQIRFRPDPNPVRTDDWLSAGGLIMQRKTARSPIVAQFDTTSRRPLGQVGDPVTLLLFEDGANLTRIRTAKITSRRRFDPPLAWKLACDENAHPGWQFTTDAPATKAFAIAIPGRVSTPIKRPPPTLALSGSRQFFNAWVDSTWKTYLQTLGTLSVRGEEYQRRSFFLEENDAGWSRQRPVAVNGPGGHQYMAFSSWLYDDHTDGRPNTTRTWLVNSWGWPVASSLGKVDIYGTTDTNGDGIDEIITSAGMIRWDGSTWQFPPIYEDEPCLAHEILPPPPGWRSGNS